MIEPVTFACGILVRFSVAVADVLSEMVVREVTVVRRAPSSPAAFCTTCRKCRGTTVTDALQKRMNTPKFPLLQPAAACRSLPQPLQPAAACLFPLINTP